MAGNCLAILPLPLSLSPFMKYELMLLSLPKDANETMILGTSFAFIGDEKSEISSISFPQLKYSKIFEPYSRVHKSSDSFFSKILEKPSIVQKKMIPHINGLVFSLI